MMNEQDIDLDGHLLKELTADPRRRDKALRALIDRYSGRFAAYYARLGYQHSDIDDLLQEVFLAVLNHAASYRGEGAASAWLWQIARNTANSRFRGERKHRAEELDDQISDRVADPYPAVEHQDLEGCVKQRFAAFARVHRDRAQVIAMAAFHGWKPADIATVIGRTAAATRQYLSQARQLLRSYLADCFTQGGFA